jgi:hypothetical protein
VEEMIASVRERLKLAEEKSKLREEERRRQVRRGKRCTEFGELRTFEKEYGGKSREKRRENAERREKERAAGNAGKARYG